MLPSWSFCSRGWKFRSVLRFAATVAGKERGLAGGDTCVLLLSRLPEALSGQKARPAVKWRVTQPSGRSCDMETCGNILTGLPLSILEWRVII